MDDNFRRETACKGALLFALGMLTGLWAGAALSGVVQVTIPRLALAAHLNGVLGGLWLVALAYTLPLLHYGAVGRARLVKFTLLPAYGNWFITLLASLLGVRGIEFTGELRNDVIAALLMAVVVVPSLLASGAWYWGLRKLAAPKQPQGMPNNT